MSPSAEAALGALVARTQAQCDPPAVMPADIALELSGEAIRPRLCIFPGPHGRDYALRPDLTLPMALARLEARRSGATFPERIAYAGRAWRMPVEGQADMEFAQIGFELYAAPRNAQRDAEALLMALEALEAAGAPGVSARIGDVALFSALIEALNLAPAWGSRLLQAFRSLSRVEDMLALAAAAPLAGDARFDDLLTTGDDEAAGDALFARLRAEGTDPVGHRRGAEIIARLREMREAAHAGALPDRVQGILRAFLTAIPDQPEQAVEALHGLAAQHGLDRFRPAITAQHDRLAAILSARPDLAARMRFATRMGRRFTYYDGFVFELFAGPESEAVASGGRYDSLLSRLSGGRVDEPAIGGMIRAERLTPPGGLRP